MQVVRITAGISLGIVLEMDLSADFTFAFRLIAGVYAIIFVLNRILPARLVRGYCCDSSGNALVYRLNGIVVYTLAILNFYQDMWPINQQTLYVLHNDCAIAGCAIGLIVSAWFYARGHENESEKIYNTRDRCMTIDQISLATGSGANSVRKVRASRARDGESAEKTNRRSRSRGKSVTSVATASSFISTASLGSKSTPGLLSTFYLGHEWNPRIFGVDIKMFLYLTGAIMLQLNLCAAMAFQAAQPAWNGHISNSMRVYVGCFSWFLIEYLLQEEIHLYTYDLFAERIGFKLIWGCLFFYPFFYCIGIHSIVNISPLHDLTPLQTGAISCMFLVGWVITRGANMQKFLYKTHPERKLVFFGLIEQRCVPGTRLLVSGFWGPARHFNYFGELIQAFALAMPGLLVGHTIMQRCLGLLYPLYYILLFIPRQMDDDVLCANKYGEKWSEYCRAVPSRIVPGVW